MRRTTVALLSAVAFVAPSATAAPPASGLPSTFVLIRTGPDGGNVWEGRIPDHHVNDPRLSDVYLPPGSKPRVAIADKVSASSTVLAELPPA